MKFLKKELRELIEQRRIQSKLLSIFTKHQRGVFQLKLSQKGGFRGRTLRRKPQNQAKDRFESWVLTKFEHIGEYSKPFHLGRYQTLETC